MSMVETVEAIESVKSEEAREADPNGDTEPARQLIVEEVDRLRAENLNLKLLQIVNRETILQQQLNELQRERTAHQERMQAMREMLESKYGINLTTHHIRPEDGVVIPRPKQG